MKILIGENIKRLRKNKNITQEELAEVFNITPAAVCKWETTETYPDITLLFPLANYFGVTIDELMGYDEEKIKKDIDDIVNKYWFLYYDKDEKAKTLITEAYAKYPNDCYIIHLYMWDKAGGFADNCKNVLLDNKEEFETLSDKILNNTNDSYLCLNAWNIKAKILHAEGKTEEALAIYEKKYPNFYHTSNQKKEQLFNKDTIEFSKYLSLNIYELTDFVLNKKMKEIWFVKNINLEQKIVESYNLLHLLEEIRIKYGYQDIIIAEYSIISEIVAYFTRFNVSSKELNYAENKQKEIKDILNNVSMKDEKIKNYLLKAYNKDIL